MRFVHGILYRIAKTVEFGLNIMSAHFLANMDDPGFAKSRKRWAVDSEMSIPSHEFSVFVFVSKTWAFRDHFLSRWTGQQVQSDPVHLDKK